MHLAAIVVDERDVDAVVAGRHLHSCAISPLFARGQRAAVLGEQISWKVGAGTALMIVGALLTISR